MSIYRSTFLSVVVGVLHYGLASIAGYFSTLFDNAGAELPWVTQLVAPGSFYYWLIPVLMLIAAFAQHRGYLSQHALNRLAGLFTVGSTILVIFAVYLPVVFLGGLVG